MQLTLLTLVQMVLGRTNIQNQTKNNHVVKTAAISIVELIIFNTIKSSKKEVTALITLHSLNHETRLLLYLGLLIYNNTGKRDLIDIHF